MADNQHLRAAYLGYSSDKKIELLSLIRQNGLNAVFVKFPTLQYPIQLPIKRQIIKWAKCCQSKQIHFFPIINFWHYEYSWIQPDHYLVDAQTAYKRTPCPLDVSVWQSTVHDRLTSLALLSKSYSIQGCLIDFEMYGADITRYPSYCLCDLCFNKYVREKGRPNNLPSLKERILFLGNPKEKKEYFSAWMTHVSSLFAKTSQDIHQINPNFFLGGMQLDADSGYFSGVREGLKCSGNPIFILSEQTYTTGYNQTNQNLYDQVTRGGTNVKFLAGFWQSQFNPAELAPHYYYTAKNFDGYWIYDLDAITEPFQGRLFENRDDYWNAIHLANKELDKLIQNPEYKSNFQIKKIGLAPSVKLKIPDMDIRKIVPLNPNFRESISLDFFLRGKGCLSFYAKEGEQIDFQINIRKIGKYKDRQVNIALLNSRKESLLTTIASSGHAGMVQLKAPYTGIYLLLCDSSTIIWKASKASHPFSLYMKPVAHFFKLNESMYLYKPVGPQRVQLEVSVDGPGEGVILSFRNKIGHLLLSKEIVSKDTICLFLEQKEQIIELSIQPMPKTSFEDVRIKILKGFVPYIASSPKALFK